MYRAKSGPAKLEEEAFPDSCDGWFLGRDAVRTGQGSLENNVALSAHIGTDADRARE